MATHRATLKIKIKPNSKEWEHLMQAEEYLTKAGVLFDKGYDTSEQVREWELDFSLKGAELDMVNKL